MNRAELNKHWRVMQRCRELPETDRVWAHRPTQEAADAEATKRERTTGSGITCYVLPPLDRP